MSNIISLLIMIGVMIWNFYGIFEVGIANATPMQWGIAGLMVVFVGRAVFQRR